MKLSNTDKINAKNPKKMSIKEMRAIAQSPEILARSEANWYGKNVSRIFSIYFTKMFILLGITPNQVTILMIISALIGSTLFAFPSLTLTIIAFFMFQIWLILDCSDGEVARITGKKSLFGPYLDRLNHYIADITIFLSLGIKIYIISSNLLFLFISTILSLTNIFSRLLFTTLNSLVVEYKVFKQEKVLKDEELDIKVNKNQNIMHRLIIIISKIPIRRVFTGTIEISAIFLVLGIFYYAYPIFNIFVITLYVYLAGNVLNVLARFVYIYFNFQKLIDRAIFSH